MVSNALVLGYHGCDLRVARKVISLRERLKASQNAWDWLGHGIYFWEDSPSRAHRWALAESQRPNSKIKFPAVIGAIIFLGNCLNLTDANALVQVRLRTMSTRDFAFLLECPPRRTEDPNFESAIWTVP